jgi:hypothetical protein
MWMTKQSHVHSGGYMAVHLFVYSSVCIDTQLAHLLDKILRQKDEGATWLLK